MSLLLNKKIAFSHVGPTFDNPVNSVLGERLQADRDLRKSFEKVQTCLLEFWNNAKICDFNSYYLVRFHDKATQ